jgi:hypothetical protein
MKIGKFMKKFNRLFEVKERMSRPGSTDIGLINDYGIGQSEFLWYIRGNQNVKKVFSSIWNSDELFTSFDGAGCYRNWHLNETWKTKSGWYHCDQVNNRYIFFFFNDFISLESISKA